MLWPDRWEKPKACDTHPILRSLTNRSLTSVFNHIDRWTQFSSARDEDGLSVKPGDKDAACWCFSGALDLCGVGGLPKRIWKGGSYVEWNDAPDRTFADVRKLAEDVDRDRGLEIYPLLNKDT